MYHVADVNTISPDDTCIYVDNIHAPPTGRILDRIRCRRIFVYRVVHVGLKAEGTKRTLQHLIIKD